MPIIAVVNQKGGVGKSTIAVCLAAELHARGLSVLLADSDPQGSAQGWAALAAEHGRESPTVVGVREGFHRPEQLPKLAKSVDWCLVDCPPYSGPITRAALAIADVALMPCGPGAFDAWALGETLELVTEAHRLRRRLRGVIVLNRVASHTALGASARTALESCGVPILSTELGQRVAYGEAVSAGMGPTQHAPQSKAAGEVRALVDELRKLVVGSRRKRPVRHEKSRPKRQRRVA